MTYRRYRGDMNEVYKILTGKYDKNLAPVLQLNEGSITRGNSLKLTTERSRYDVRKFSFTSRVVSIWNSLPNEVVEAESLNTFKYRLDKFWTNQECFYNYKAKLTGISIHGLDLSMLQRWISR